MPKLDLRSRAQSVCSVSVPLIKESTSVEQSQETFLGKPLSSNMNFDFQKTIKNEDSRFKCVDLMVF